MKYYITLLLIIFCENLSSQKLTRIDSIFNQQANKIKSYNIDTYKNSLKDLKNAKIQKDTINILNVYSDMAYYFYYEKNMDSTLFYNRKIEKLIPFIKSKIIGEEYSKIIGDIAFRTQKFLGFTDKVNNYYSELYNYSVKNNILRHKNYVLLIYAEKLIKQNKIEKAIPILLNLLKPDPRTGFIHYEFDIYDKIINIYNNNDPNKSLKYINLAKEKINRISNSIIKNNRNDLLDIIIAEYKIAVNKNNEAEIILDNVLNRNNLFIINDYKSRLYHNKYIIAFKNKSYSKAIHNLDLSIEYCLDINLKKEYLNLLSNLFEINNDYLNLQKAYIRINEINRILYSQIDDQMSGNFQLKIDNLNYQNAIQKKIIENSNLINENKFQNSLRVYLIFFLIILSISFTITIHFFKKNFSNLKKINFLEIQKNKFNERIFQEREVEFKLFYDFIKDKNLELLNFYKEYEKEFDKNTIDNNFKNFQNLKKIIDDTKDIDNLFERFENEHSNFVLKLKNRFQNLTKNDIRHCIMLKLGVSVKDSASILSVSEHAIRNARNRLFKKLNIKEGKNSIKVFTSLEED